MSAYEAVFGQEFDHEFACSKEKARKCWTIEEQLQVTNDTAFQEYVKEYFMLMQTETKMTQVMKMTRVISLMTTSMKPRRRR